MDKISELYKIVKPISDILKEKMDEIETLLGDIEEDTKISDAEWDIVDDIRSSLQILSSRFKEFEEQIGETK